MNKIMKGAQTLPAGRLTRHTSMHNRAMRAASIPQHTSAYHNSKSIQGPLIGYSQRLMHADFVRTRLMVGIFTRCSG